MHTSKFPTTTPPVNDNELHQRVQQLREYYAPYLRSLPEPAAVRTRTELSDGWRWKYEVEDFVTGPRPTAPDWYRMDMDDADWERTTVPEWRYDQSEPFGTKPDPNSHRLDSRIAWYRTDFASTAPSSEQRVFLCFAGVTWEAEVWLNGVYLGNHTAYWEAFRFDVTGIIQENNVLAVRVLAGSALGEPMSGWTVLSSALALHPRHVRDAAQSVLGQREIFGFKGSCFGTGFGIHREVLLETTGRTIITEMFVRGDLTSEQAKIKIETNSVDDKELTFDVQLLPENFTGQSFETTMSRKVQLGAGTQTLEIPMPGARLWQPGDPCLYRCRVIIRDGARIVDAHDALFGYRSFRKVTAKDAAMRLPEGMFLLNEKPVYLRGAAVSPALNTLWYWHEDHKLLDALLMLKAANFTALRACEHIQFAEVLELQDRLGIMSEQDLVGVGDSYVPVESGGANTGSVPMPVLVELSGRFASYCYNHPGVVMLTTGGIETSYDPVDTVPAVLAIDPERIIKPISGHMKDWGTSYDCPPPDYPTLALEHWDNVVNDFHCYNGWYRRGLAFSKLSQRYPPERRMFTVGEFGAEALDALSTMHHYPAHLQPPPGDTDALWGQAQVKRGDPRLTIGFRGRRPHNLAQYIEASQHYQSDVYAEQITGFRLSPRCLAGYFVFHLIDALPAEWQKSFISFDFTPKKGYYELAQLNQPVVPLFQVTDEGKTLLLWVANDREETIPNCCLSWSIERDGKIILQGEELVDVPSLDAVQFATIDLSATLPDTPVMTVSLALYDATGTLISQSRREVFLHAWLPPSFTIQAPPTMLIPRLVDASAAGDPDCVDWNQAAPITGWRQVEGPATEHIIEARIAHDGVYLYVKLAEAVVAANLQIDDGIWYGEDWELFFATGRDTPFRQFGINPKGAFLEAVSTDELPHCGARVTSRLEADHWTVQLALPLSTLVPGGLQSGSVCYGNFYRTAGSGDNYREMLAWSPNYKPTYLMPERFGELKLE